MRLPVFALISLLAATVCPAADYPAATGYVNDFAEKLPAADRQSLDARLRAFEQKTTIEVALAIVPSLQGESLETYATGLFRAWGVGKRGANNGVLFLWAPTERKVRIEVGRGLETYLDNATATDIARRVTAQFRDQKFTEGVYAGIDEILSRLEAAAPPPAPTPTAPAPADSTQTAQSSTSDWIIFAVVAAAGIGIILLFLRRRMQHLRAEVPQELQHCTARLTEGEACRKQADSDIAALRTEAPPEIYNSAAETFGRALQLLQQLRKDALTLRNRPLQKGHDVRSVHHDLAHWEHEMSLTEAEFGGIGATLQAVRSHREESLQMVDGLGVALQDFAARNAAGQLPGCAETLLPAAQETYAKARVAMGATPPNWLQIHDLLSDVRDCLNGIENNGRMPSRSRIWPGSEDDSPAMAMMMMFMMSQSNSGGGGFSSSGSDFGGFSDSGGGGSDFGGGGDSGGGFGGGDSGGGGGSDSY